jgi:hypothetical protein
MPTRIAANIAAGSARHELIMRTIAPIAILLLCSTLASGQNTQLPRSTAPDRASVYIISPADGETVSSPVTVKFGLQAMGVAPAGVQQANTGHHHLLIDVAQLPPENMPLPASEQIVHFGGGQTETTIELAPGTHTLQLVLGDHLHIPHDPPVRSRQITITVTE